MADLPSSPKSSSEAREADPSTENEVRQESGLERLSDAMEAWRLFMARTDELAQEFLLENEDLKELLEPLVDAWRVRQAIWLRGRESDVGRLTPESPNPASVDSSPVDSG